MARRRRTSPAEDVVELFAYLPWWVGVAAAIVLYLVLHGLAGREVNAPVEPGQMGAFVKQGLTQALAQVGQYIVPALCLAGAGLSALGRQKRKALLTDVAQENAQSALDGLPWREFEQLVGEAFRMRGYRVTETGGDGADGGIDLVLHKQGEKLLVQCKQWRALKVGVGIVRELYGVMAAEGASGGFVVTSGRFTAEAKAFAQGRNVTLVDGPALLLLLRPAQVARQKATATPASIITPATTPATTPAMTPAMAPAQPTTESTQHSCPACAKPMVRRVAKKGKNAGRTFWGCTAYPACRGTRLDV